MTLDLSVKSFSCIWRHLRASFMVTNEPICFHVGSQKGNCLCDNSLQGLKDDEELFSIGVRCILGQFEV